MRQEQLFNTLEAGHEPRIRTVEIAANHEYVGWCCRNGPATQNSFVHTRGRFKWFENSVPKVLPQRYLLPLGATGIGLAVGVLVWFGGGRRLLSPPSPSRTPEDVAGGASVRPSHRRASSVPEPPLTGGPPPKDETRLPQTDDRPESANGPLAVDSLRKEAFDLGQQLLQQFPEGTGPMVLMAKLHHQFGNRAEAVRWWQKVLKACLDGPGANHRRAAAAYTNMGTMAADRGDYQGAAELFRKACQADPDQPGAHQRLGHALLQLGRADEAVQALEEELRRHPGAKTPYRTLGQAHLEQGHFQQAVASFRKGLQLLPDDMRAYYGLAIAYTRLGQMEQARQYRERFRQLQAASDKTIRAERKEFDNLDWMRRAVAPMHRYAAGVYFQHGRSAEAEQQLKRAAELDGDDQVSRQRLVDFYMRQRRFADALPFCRQLSQIAPSVAAYHRNTGVILASLRRFDAAEQALRKGVQLDPEGPSGYASLVQVLLVGTRKFPDAQTAAEKLVQLQPTATNYYLLCLACEANKDLARAKEAIEQGYQRFPGDARIRRERQRLRSGTDPRPSQEKS